MASERVAVLGAGIQGVSAALALAHQGYNVTLIDQARDCLRRASLRNTGKIHLGLVYANDPSLQTAELMLNASLNFAPLLETWLGEPLDWHRWRSRPFTYAVLNDSLCSPETLFQQYERLEQRRRDLPKQTRSHYLGEPLGRLWHSVPVPSYLNPGRTVAAIETPEVGLSLDPFCRRLREAVASNDRITTSFQQRIDDVKRTAGGFRISGTMADQSPWSTDAGVVVNCLWDGRLAIDAQMGMVPEAPFVWRLKYRVFAPLPTSLKSIPSLSFVLGPYGDIIPHDDICYFTWYPVLRQGWSTSINTPEEWQAACRGEVDEAVQTQLSRELFEAMSQLIPDLKDCRGRATDAGVIFALGDSDIDNPESRFHQRHQVGVQSQDGYFSIDTGKFTCGPLFAQQLAQELA